MSEYRVIINLSSVSGLEREVNQKLEQGWTLLGGVSVSSGNMAATAIFAQAMIREDSDRRIR